MKKKFVYNRRYKLIGVDRGWFTGGEITFPRALLPHKLDGFYRSVWACVAHNGVTYSASDENFAYAFRRMTACREPDSVEEPPGSPYGNAAERELRENQKRFFKGATWASVLTQMQQRYAPYLTLDSQEEEMRLHAADPHVKRLLRIQCRIELEGTMQVADRLWLKSVLVKMKREEIAKPGKYPRVIGDLSVAASLQGFIITLLLKTAQANEDIQFAGGDIRFVKSPEPAILADTYEKLEDPPGTFFFVYFSDDACFARRVNGKIIRFNMDISSCDTSHGRPVFESLVQSVPLDCQPQMQLLVDQCSLPARIESLGTKGATLLLAAEDPVLYSGATITTSINNIANVSLAVALMQTEPTACDLKPNFEHDEKCATCARLIKAARQPGYIVELTPCQTISQLQFLKTSPVRDTNGALRAVLNPGVLVRLMGACKGDLPGKGCVVTRANNFQRLLVSGYMSNMDNPWLDAIRSRLSRACGRSMGATQLKKMQLRVDGLWADKLTVVASERYTVTDEALFERYELTDEEYLGVYALVEGCTYGHTTGNRGLSKLLAKDYGLACNDVFTSLVDTRETVPPNWRA